MLRDADPEPHIRSAPVSRVEKRACLEGGVVPRAELRRNRLRQAYRIGAVNWRSWWTRSRRDRRRTVIDVSSATAVR